VSKIINIMKADIRLWRAQTSERFESVQMELEAIKKRLDRLDKPVNTSPSSGRKKNRVPTPDRPGVMAAAGIGEDPLRGD
jgi:hypothetical protein